MYILIGIGVSTVTKRLLIGVNLRLWRSYCMCYKAVMQLGCIPVPLYTDKLFRSNSADFIHITTPRKKPKLTKQTKRKNQKLKVKF